MSFLALLTGQLFIRFFPSLKLFLVLFEAMATALCHDPVYVISLLMIRRKISDSIFDPVY
jgi:hypothetical protein